MAEKRAMADMKKKTTSAKKKDMSKTKKTTKVSKKDLKVIKGGRMTESINCRCGSA